MTLTWNVSDIVVVCQNEAEIEALEAAGYRAMLVPGPEEFGPAPKAEHYVVATKSDARGIGTELVKSGVCTDWQVTVSPLGDHPDLTHALHEGGVDSDPCDRTRRQVDLRRGGASPHRCH